MIEYLIGALVGCAATGLVAGLIAEWQARQRRPEPQRVTPEDVRPLSDGLASLSRAMRVTHSRGADELQALAYQALELECKARSTLPYAPIRFTDADVGPLLRRSAPTYRGQK